MSEEEEESYEELYLKKPNQAHLLDAYTSELDKLLRQFVMEKSFCSIAPSQKLKDECNVKTGRLKIAIDAVLNDIKETVDTYGMM